MAEQYLPPKNRFAGEWVGDYKLLEEIGRGKIGVVYKAEQHVTGDLVACKLIPSENVKGGKWITELEKIGKLRGIPTVAQYKNKTTQDFNGIPYICIMYEFIGDEEQCAMNLRDYQ